MVAVVDRLSDPRVLDVPCRYCNAHRKVPCTEPGVLAPGWHHSTRIVDYERRLTPAQRAHFRSTQSFAVRAYGP